MESIKTVQQQWQEFLSAVDPRGRFGRTQKREMRRAFLSGFYSMLVTCKDIAAIDSEDAGAAKMEELYQECESSLRGMIREDYQQN